MTTRRSILAAALSAAFLPLAGLFAAPKRPEVCEEYVCYLKSFVMNMGGDGLYSADAVWRMPGENWRLTSSVGVGVPSFVFKDGKALITWTPSAAMM